MVGSVVTGGGHFQPIPKSCVMLSSGRDLKGREGVWAKLDQPVHLAIIILCFYKKQTYFRKYILLPIQTTLCLCNYTYCLTLFQKRAAPFPSRILKEMI